MVGGEVIESSLSDADKGRINDAIVRAEEETGFEFCVVLEKRVGGDPRADAERAFHAMSLHERPSVMIMVTPQARTIEVITAADISDRLSDQSCEEAVRVMTGLFSTGDMIDGLVRGIDVLAERTGPRHDGRNGHSGPDLPNLIEVEGSESGPEGSETA